ncbi:MAG: DUF4124 domain-containing protein [Pseudomonadota bacterium]|nr:DUF4124 domain-containing protein [Pseudomonadota bacterium]
MQTRNRISYAAIALVATGSLWTGTYIVRSAQLAAEERAAEERLAELSRSAAPFVGAAAQTMMQPVQDGTVQALNDLNRQFLLKEAARKEKLAAEREAGIPKAYRWKDPAGTWHLSQTPPPNDAEAVEVIPVTIR